MQVSESSPVLMRARPSVLNYLFLFLWPVVFLGLFKYGRIAFFLFWAGELITLFGVVLNIYFQEWQVTNRTFSVKTLFSMKDEGVEIEEIKGIEIARHFFFQKWFNTGDLIIETHRPDGLLLVVHGVEDPEGFKSFIYSLRRL